jgi:hypothetical protein
MQAVDVETLIDQGLERFTAGDLAGAGRLWLAASETAPQHPRLRAYLEHLRQHSPETMAELEAEAELEAVARMQAESDAETESEAGVESEVGVESELDAESELQAVSELEAEAAAEASCIAAALETSSATDAPGQAEGHVARKSRTELRSEFEIEAGRRDSSGGDDSGGGEPVGRAGSATAGEAERRTATGSKARTGAGSKARMGAGSNAAAGFRIDAGAGTVIDADAGAEIDGGGEKGADAESTAGSEPGSEPNSEPNSDAWAQGGSPLPPMEVSSRGPGLGLVAAGQSAPADEVTQEDPESLVPTMRELMSLDNFSGALAAAQSVLSRDPRDAEARGVADLCRERLETIYISKLGALCAVPSVRMPPGEVIWLDLDHRSGFVLAQVDGASSYEEIVELTGMDRLEALRILCDLLQTHVIGAES